MAQPVSSRTAHGRSGPNAMPTLQKALADKDTLVLDIFFVDGDKLSRCPASMWWRDGGLLWADPGWPSEPGHAFHHFPGTIEGDGPWTVTPTEDSVVKSIRIRQMAENDDIARGEYLTWEEFRAMPHGQPYTAAAALEAAATFFSFDAQRGR
jgi:hypothetical protein